MHWMSEYVSCDDLHCVRWSVVQQLPYHWQWRVRHHRCSQRTSACGDKQHTPHDTHQTLHQIKWNCTQESTASNLITVRHSAGSGKLSTVLTWERYEVVTLRVSLVLLHRQDLGICHSTAYTRCDARRAELSHYTKLDSFDSKVAVQPTWMAWGCFPQYTARKLLADVMMQFHSGAGLWSTAAKHCDYSP